MLGRRRWRGWAATATAVAMVAALAALAGEVPAYGDAHAPPPFPTNCPAAQYPPAGYPLNAKPIRYEVPFKGIIFGGEINLPPNVRIPNLYASVCGLVQLPELSGRIASDNIDLATPNLYVSGLEALPASVKFGDLISTISLKPAHNGGLDITLSGLTTSSVTTLGMTCGITINAKFSTISDGVLAGRPVTGPTKQGQAEVVSNSFAVPATQASATCPASIAQTFNKLLGLPARAGVGTFVAPFCFDFELEGLNNPAPTQACPWPR